MTRALPAAALALLLGGCVAGQGVPAAAVHAPAVRQAPTSTPQQLYGELFVAVQLARIFPDGKTFVDAVPRRSPAAIMAEYRAGDFTTPVALRQFVRDNFATPPPPATRSPGLTSSGPRLSLTQHIQALWPTLTRSPVDPPAGSSAIGLPERYVVPGGRFRELYYWDSYFTMLGLVEDGRDDLVEAMIDNFVSLVERFGHVPNGTRSYYVGRSQPPFLHAMMALSKNREPAVAERRLAALRAEHAWWMAGDHRARMPDGAVLNRFAGGDTTPRDESYREDVETARASSRPATDVYAALRAGAESGWDFSSRWLTDGRTLATIDTENVVPADLNALLYGLERAIADGCRVAGDRACATRFDEAAEGRRTAVERWLWSDAEGRYGDFDLARGALRPGLTAAALTPLFTGLAAPDRARRVARTTRARLVAPGGLRTTLVDTGQQWDAPNGWAPLQWIAVAGLRRYGDDALAHTIATRWLATVETEYHASGKLLEKYDVEERRPGGGGEYPTQDGFGWTNGVTRALQAWVTAAE